ncbi:spoIIIJ-associated protein [Halanaerobium saccharolyticum]|jgi:spoIIIJ-associated protein|uniref:RNA-binding protein KhpB n=1 Tax=Halanaerobium saccharolyticum TaxID=43595 RepID=A0A2T5RI67_9FIRM|nr:MULTISPECIES: RNA-binding cell elongation regulator Jag/EloR [Halanaerobium]PTV97910.1 spoIIIJ-associated protein [Halanaerobium saccharolyticum]PUU89809.1 MAG: spoIIIJ-associated protein [Halanaerobium sp.]PUU95067.1 MAG: spoIIIJ-associated protein [Halanaerobium sp.]TDP96008.1 spoIIIJ-associated protein [Halanaerobium saccharolyticum]
MKSIKVEAKNVEKAVEKALNKLGITREDAEINVIDEGSKGLLGLIGTKDAVVEVKEVFDPVKKGKEFLESLLEKANINVGVEIMEEKSDAEQVVYNLTGEKELGLVIGHRGETLDAMQYLTSIYINKELEEYFRVLLDAEGYRDRRQQTLERLAERLAAKAERKKRKVVLEPMPPHERRIIHIALKENKNVKSYSEGKEPYRKVMIEPLDK